MSDQNNQTQHNKLSYKQVVTANGIGWLTQAYALFKHKPLAWLSSMLIMMILLLILLFIPVVQLFAVVLTPVFTAGMMVAANNIRNGREFTVNNLFSGFERAFNPLLIVGLIYLGSTFLSTAFALEIAEWLGRPMMQVTPEMLTSENFDLQAFGESLLIPLLIMMGLMVPVLMANWFAPALVILRQEKPLDALKQSFKACSLNIKAFTLYGLAAMLGVIIITILMSFIMLLIPSLSFLFSLLSNLFFMSLAFASMYTSFEDIFEQQTQDKTDTAEEQDNSSSDDEGPDTIIV